VELGWDEGRIQSEIAEYRKFVGGTGVAAAPHHGSANGHARRDGANERVAVGKSNKSST